MHRLQFWVRKFRSNVLSAHPIWGRCEWPLCGGGPVLGKAWERAWGWARAARQQTAARFSCCMPSPSSFWVLWTCEVCGICALHRCREPETGRWDWNVRVSSQAQLWRNPRLKPDILLLSISKVLVLNPFYWSIAYAGKPLSQGNIQIQSPGG